MPNKADLRDGIVNESKQQFRELCTQYQDVFSVDSSDIENMGLVTMHIDAVDSPPIS